MSTEKPSRPPASYKYGALLTLVVQNSMLILTMRYSRVMDVPDRYLTSTSVLLNEVLKMVICLAISAYLMGVRTTVREVFGEDHWKMSIPAALYTLQNSMQYVAVSNLQATTFQVTYQLKILTTAFFAVTILHKRLRGVQWLALMLLTAGVAVVSLPDEVWAALRQYVRLGDGSVAVPAPVPATDAQRAAVNSTVGLLAVTLACILSGLAGIYFEKVLKGSRKVSLWTRNIQLSFYSLFPAFFIGVLLKDGREIAEKGFFYGYNPVVWLVIFLQAAGGLIVAICVKYADNIAKNFATSLSILISAVASVYMFGTSLTLSFGVGAAMVIGATFWYSSAE